ncbi:MAG: hypothetical protein Q7T23_09050 [Phenylobacterium sp.]|nr:hypothetical protein [Phenylobacterium sp.]
MSEVLIFPTNEPLQPPDALECATVAAMMLWPEDAAMRARWIRASRIQLWAPQVDAMPAHILREFVKDVLGSTERLEDLKEAADRRFKDGLIKGIEVFEAVRLGHFLPDDAQLHSIRERISDAVGGEIKPESLGKNTSRFAKFRPVAHLWAEYCNAARAAAAVADTAGTSIPTKEPFPCRPIDLPMFLRQAEGFRWKAEKTKPSKHSKETAMRPGEAVELPREVKAILPKIENLRVAW